jgi:hypothetical protein
MRAAFVLCCLEGLTNTEAAHELGCPAGTVDSRLHAARARLRDRLSRRGFAPGALAGLIAASLPHSCVAAAVGIGAGVTPPAAVIALAEAASRTMMKGMIPMKLVGAALLAIVFAGVVWAFGGPKESTPTPKEEGEGRIALWRDGHPVTFAPGAKGIPLPSGFEGKPGRLRFGPGGKVLIYLQRRSTLRPTDSDKDDQVYLGAGKAAKLIDPGVSPCHAFWGADGVVYGYGLERPKRAEADVDLTTDFVNWTFDPRTGKATRLKLPGNVSILDLSPDGKTFLVLLYQKPAGARGIWADYRLGTLPVGGGDLTPLTKLGESTPSELRYSPDGRSVLGTMYRTVAGNLIPELIVFDLKARTRTAVAVPKDAHVHGSCWSPDGKRVAYVWEPHKAYEERNAKEGPVVPGKETKAIYTVTVAKPDGSDAKDVFTESEYWFGSIDWSVIPASPDPPGGGASKKRKDDEESVAAHLKALRSPDDKTRAAAAAALRRIVAKYPSGTIYLASKDGGEAAWREKVNRVTVGMTKAEVLKILPPFKDAPESAEHGSGDSHIVSYRLDHHWMVTVYYRNPGKVLAPPTLTRRALRIDFAPPAGFTGTWVTWHVNGQKGFERRYRNGNYDGVLTSFHDHGGKHFEQHYVDNVIHGTDTGWYPDGKLSYTARYRDGKKEGTWTHWYANGKKHSEAIYAGGKLDGRDTTWHENGQVGSVNDYKAGVRHGREASWDVNGVLHYDRRYVDGKLVE